MIDPDPTAGDGFGSSVLVLSNGNVLITSPNDNLGGTNAGAVYLFDGLSGALISSLVGSAEIIPLSNGNYLLNNPYWNGGRGAVTWGNGTTGVSGTVSDANSLVGSSPGDVVGGYGRGVILLSNGNYVVDSEDWNGQRGAVSWGNGSTGISGIVSADNSLVGSNLGDQVGYYVTPLSDGNYVVASPNWNGGRGAATWGDGSMGISGTISAANSLVGSDSGDGVGSGAVTPLSNGNYLVDSASWNGNRGAVSWGNGGTGVSGIVSDANSLVGTNPGDEVGSGITALSNGNYVILSPDWQGGYPIGRGAVTWGNGSTGVSGIVSAANSLVGSNPGDQLGGYPGGLVLLSNGNYVVDSPHWNDNRGAVTWGNGGTGVSGIVSAANSLVGSNPGDYVGGSGIAPLSNGNYVVGSGSWNSNRGAATWGNGSTAISGTISAANSLVGTGGSIYITALSNGNYVVSSVNAATWGNSSTGVSGTISAVNSLVGTGGSQVIPLSNGNYVALSPSWNSNRGAVTWGNGSTGVSGIVSAANSLVGSNPGDQLGGLALLSNGNYVVDSPHWNDNRGAATWANGSTGVSGTITEANSLVGSYPSNDVDFGYAFVIPLSNGNYVVATPNWNDGRGAVTWGNGSTRVNGTISDANSLVGSNPGDEVGGGGDPRLFPAGITALSNGNYVVASPVWNGRFGAVTWSDGSTGASGIVSEANSLVGSNPGDEVGVGGIIPLSNGSYVVWSPFRGAATWASGVSGQTLDGLNTITPQNSLLGTFAYPEPGSSIDNPIDQTFLVPFATQVAVGFSNPSLLAYAMARSQPVTITPSFLTSTLDTGTAVVLQASNDITVNSPIAVNADGQGVALTLEAGRSLVLNASITTDNGALTLIANDDLANGVVDAESRSGRRSHQHGPRHGPEYRLGTVNGGAA